MLIIIFSSSKGLSVLIKISAGIAYFFNPIKNCVVISNRDVSNIMKEKMPATFATVETVKSAEFGSLPVKKLKGEGGLGDLATRLGNNYYNDYVRY